MRSLSLPYSTYYAVCNALRERFILETFVTFKLINLRKIRWAGYVAPMGEMRNYTKFCSKSLKGRGHSEVVGDWNRKVWTGYIWFSIGISSVVLYT
jgi:hypothetical protein